MFRLLVTKKYDPVQRIVPPFNLSFLHFVHSRRFWIFLSLASIQFSLTHWAIDLVITQGAHSPRSALCWLRLLLTIEAHPSFTYMRNAGLKLKVLWYHVETHYMQSWGTINCMNWCGENVCGWYELMSQIGISNCNITVLLYALIVIQNTILSVQLYCWCSFDVHRGWPTPLQWLCSMQAEENAA